MNSFQSDVLAFHRAMEMPDGTGPFHRPELRASLILEEAFETAAALGCHLRLANGEEVKFEDLNIAGGGPLLEAEVIDGLCDVIYVAAGCAVEMGIDLEPFYAEVQRSNMAKVGGPIREDGKRLKPEGWTPPDIAGILALVRQMEPRPIPEPESMPLPWEPEIEVHKNPPIGGDMYVHRNEPE